MSVKRACIFLFLSGVFLVLHSGQVPVFEPWVEHRRQPAPWDHEKPLLQEDLRGEQYSSAAVQDSRSVVVGTSKNGAPKVNRIEKATVARTQPEVAKQVPAEVEEEAPMLVIREMSPEEVMEHRKETYRRLAGAKGTFHDATGRKLPEVVPDILEEDIPNHSDVVILLDHTSSMGDDIESMRDMLADIKEKLQKKSGIRIGAATFSDLKHRPNIGYRFLPLGKGLDALDKFLYETPLIGSVEDMYGALAKAIREFNWRPGAKRTLIVISDEDPAPPYDSISSLEEVRQLCRQTNPETILHTILLSKD